MGDSRKEAELRIIGETKSIVFSRGRSSEEGPGDFPLLGQRRLISKFDVPGVGRPA
jgi:hypothetical protein